MFVHPESVSRSRRTATAIALVILMLAAAWAVSSSSSGPSVASAATKRCAQGKQAVVHRGRVVCARKCPAGKKRKITRRGKVRCVRKRRANTTPPTPSGENQAPGTGSTGSEGQAPSGPVEGGYKGDTEQGREVTFTVGGGEVRDFQAGINLWCNTTYANRQTIDFIANIPPLTIGPDGTFSYKGDSDKGNMEISGTVTGNTATGTIGMNRGDTNNSGGQMYYGSCQAHDVKWSAKTG